MTVWAAPRNWKKSGEPGSTPASCSPARMTGPKVSEPASRLAMPPPGTDSSALPTVGSTVRNPVPTMAPSEAPTKLMLEPSKSAIPSPSMSMNGTFNASVERST